MFKLLTTIEHSHAINKKENVILGSSQVKNFYWTNILALGENPKKLSFLTKKKGWLLYLKSSPGS